MKSEAPANSTHPLMKGMDKYLRVGRYKTSEGYLKPNKHNIPHVFVTPECVDKAIDFANTLFWALRKKGHYVDLREYNRVGFWAPKYEIFEAEDKAKTFSDSWSPGRATYVEVNGAGFCMVIYEMLTQEEVTYIDGTYYRDLEMTPLLIRKMSRYHTWRTTKDYPTGRLCLLVYSYDGWVRKWKEVKKSTLEKQIPSVIRLLRQSAPELLETKERLRVEAEKRHEEWEEKMRRMAIKQEEELVAKATAKSKEKIEEIISSWNKASALHGFFSTIERSVEENDDPRKEALLERIQLAKELIGTVDPIDYLAEWKTPVEIADQLRSRRLY